MNRQKNSRARLLLILLGLLPVTWLGLYLAPYLGDGLAGLLTGLNAAIEHPFSIQITDRTLESVTGCLGIYLLAVGIALSSRRNTRNGEEHGSAQWGSAREVNRMFAQKKSKILTRHVRLGLDSTKHKRSLNVLVIGGSGAAKTRSYVLPNVLEANSNYVITDPKSEVLLKLP